jgi:hypothetical protein
MRSRIARSICDHETDRLTALLGNPAGAFDVPGRRVGFIFSS